MSDNSGAPQRVAGYNQFVKLVRKGRASKVYLASDADIFFAEKIKTELSGRGEIILETRYSSKDLATMAGVDVPTAVITEIN